MNVDELKPTKSERQRAYEKKTGYAATAKYQKEKTKNVSLRLFINTEMDIINHMATIENKNGYLKQLIRQDIAKKQVGE